MRKLSLAAVSLGTILTAGFLMPNHAEALIGAPGSGRSRPAQRPALPMRCIWRRLGRAIKARSHLYAFNLWPTYGSFAMPALKPAQRSPLRSRWPNHSQYVRTACDSDQFGASQRTDEERHKRTHTPQGTA